MPSKVDPKGCSSRLAEMFGVGWPIPKSRRANGVDRTPKHARASNRGGMLAITGPKNS